MIKTLFSLIGWLISCHKKEKEVMWLAQSHEIKDVK